MSLLKPFNFQKWLDENRHLLKPPVANKNLTPDSDDFIVMVVAGPNARKDYHYNETEEFFYQLEGHITVKVQVDGEAETLELGPGDMMVVPAKTPHSPIRHEGSLGLVIERVRQGRGFTDGLMWFCESCNEKLHETFFELKDIENEFLPKFKEYYASQELRTCNSCHQVMEADSRFI